MSKWGMVAFASLLDPGGSFPVQETILMTSKIMRARKQEGRQHLRWWAKTSCWKQCPSLPRQQNDLGKTGGRTWPLQLVQCGESGNMHGLPWAGKKLWTHTQTHVTAAFSVRWQCRLAGKAFVHLIQKHSMHSNVDCRQTSKMYFFLEIKIKLRLLDKTV